MAPGRRRRTTPATAPLAGALLALLAACGAGDTRAAGGTGGDRAAPGPQPASAPARGVAVDDAPGGDVPGGAALSVAEARAEPAGGRWTPRLAGLVGRWVGEVQRQTSGRVRPDEVEVALHVRGLASGVEHAALHADAPHVPASNMKLVTTAAALVLLGSNVDFLTPFEAGGPVERGVLRGDLIVRAAGDPLCSPDGDARVEGRLGRVARELVAAGVTRVSGDVVLDEGTFATPAPGPGWPDASQHWQEYCARAGGFSVNGGVLRASITPGASGGAARIEVHPRPHGLRTNYGVETGGRTLDVRVGATTTTATVVGRIPAGRSTYVAEFAHPDPVDLFGAVLLDQLERNGVRVNGGVRRARGAPPGERLAELRSPVGDALGPINAESRNGVADQLFLALGHTVAGAGTRAGGSEATRSALARLGVPAEGLVQVDGSGLSRDNRVSARQITGLVAAVLAREEEETARAFRASLAVAGRSGTLAKRLRDSVAAGRVRAKTGWIAGASAISGVLTTLKGEELVFSILVRYPATAGGLNARCFKPMQDEILEKLVVEAP